MDKIGACRHYDSHNVSTVSHVATATLYTGQSRSAPFDVGARVQSLRGRRVSGEFGCSEVSYG